MDGKGAPLTPSWLQSKGLSAPHAVLIADALRVGSNIVSSGALTAPQARPLSNDQVSHAKCSLVDTVDASWRSFCAAMMDCGDAKSAGFWQEQLSLGVNSSRPQSSLTSTQPIRMVASNDSYSIFWSRHFDRSLVADSGLPVTMGPDCIGAEELAFAMDYDTTLRYATTKTPSPDMAVEYLSKTMLAALSARNAIAVFDRKSGLPSSLICHTGLFSADDSPLFLLAALTFDRPKQECRVKCIFAGDPATSVVLHKALLALYGEVGTGLISQLADVRLMLAPHCLPAETEDSVSLRLAAACMQFDPSFTISSVEMRDVAQLFARPIDALLHNSGELLCSYVPIHICAAIATSVSASASMGESVASAASRAITTRVNELIRDTAMHVIKAPRRCIPCCVTVAGYRTVLANGVGALLVPLIAADMSVNGALAFQPVWNNSTKRGSYRPLRLLQRSELLMSVRSCQPVSESWVFTLLDSLLPGPLTGLDFTTSMAAMSVSAITSTLSHPTQLGGPPSMMGIPFLHQLRSMPTASQLVPLGMQQSVGIFQDAASGIDLSLAFGMEASLASVEALVGDNKLYPPIESASFSKVESTMGPDVNDKPSAKTATDLLAESPILPAPTTATDTSAVQADTKVSTAVVEHPPSKPKVSTYAALAASTPSSSSQQSSKPTSKAPSNPSPEPAPVAKRKDDKILPSSVNINGRVFHMPMQGTITDWKTEAGQFFTITVSKSEHSKLAAAMRAVWKSENNDRRLRASEKETVLSFMISQYELVHDDVDEASYEPRDCVDIPVHFWVDVTVDKKTGFTVFNAVSLIHASSTGLHELRPTILPRECEEEVSSTPLGMTKTFSHLSSFVETALTDIEQDAQKVENDLVDMDGFERVASKRRGGRS